MEEDNIYKNFLKENPSFGTLKVQVYMANQAIPLANIKIIIQKEIENKTFTIYEGKTDESGIVNNIKLPAPNITNMDNPSYITYKLMVQHPSYQGPTYYSIPVYSNQKMIQYVNLIPIYKETDNE